MYVLPLTTYLITSQFDKHSIRQLSEIQSHRLVSHTYSHPTLNIFQRTFEPIFRNGRVTKNLSENISNIIDQTL